MHAHILSTRLGVLLTERQRGLLPRQQRTAVRMTLSLGGARPLLLAKRLGHGLHPRLRWMHSRSS